MATSASTTRVVGRDIDPTPVVAVLGIVDALPGPPPGVRLSDGGHLCVVGPAARSLSGSRWAWEHGHRSGPPPALDLAVHAEVTAFVRAAVAAGLLEGAHDAADGLGVALAEMAVRSGVGFDVTAAGDGGPLDHAWLFATSASRAVLCVTPERLAEVRDAAFAARVPLVEIGRAGGERLTVAGLLDLPYASRVGMARPSRPPWPRRHARAAS